MSAISVRGLRKTYGSNTAVADISFEVEEGEIFGIIGPNGSGKTTTVECLQGLRDADSGELSVLGLHPLRDRQRLRAQVGSQLQESALPDRIKVWEALDLFASLSPASVDWRELMEQWGLAEKKNAVFSSLSGGQRQRLFVALALVNAPRVVFLDEMTTGLDPAARRVAWELIRNIRARGTTVVLVTHFMDEAEHLCDRIAVFNRGLVADLDTPAELVSRHAGAATVRFTAHDGASLDWLAGVRGVSAVRREGRRVEVAGEGPILAYTAAALVERGMAPADLSVERARLEDAYLKLTAGNPAA
jgi:ABC-2 type transport system ATP-binding protein